MHFPSLELMGFFMVPIGWPLFLLSQYELSSPRPEESSFICCFQEPSLDKDITWGLQTPGFIPGLFRLSVTFCIILHILFFFFFFEKAKSYM